MQLFEEVKQGSKTLEIELRRFIDLCDEFEIYSFHEMDQSPGIIVVSFRPPPDCFGPNGPFSGSRWPMEARRGICSGHWRYIIMPAALEKKIPVDADHSNLVKFETSRHPTYRDVHEYYAADQSPLQWPYAIFVRNPYETLFNFKFLLFCFSAEYLFTILTCGVL